MSRSALLFDLDGTLLNTLEDLTDSVNHALAAHGFAALSQAQVRPLLGNGIRALVAGCVPDGEANPAFEACFSTFRSWYDGHCRVKTRPYDGIPELLATLSRQGWRMALVSNKVDSAVQQLRRDFFADTLPVALGQTDRLRRKPAPDMPLQALRQLGAAPEEAIYIGDSEVDFATARAAKLACVLVTWGFRDRAALEALHPEALADRPEQLPEILAAL